MNRRELIVLSGAAIAGSMIRSRSTDSRDVKLDRTVRPHQNKPWHRQALRWGQTWLFDDLPANYDIAWWREYWERTAVQGVVLNAGGATAFYPSKFPLHRRAKNLNGRDFYGELVEVAHQAGLAVLARMDSAMADENSLRAHPEWFALGSSGKRYREGDSYLTCIHSSYHDEYVPGILREIIERTHPEGIVESGWNKITHRIICQCENCVRKFRDKTGHALPQREDWDDPAYRQWLEWNYERRTELWQFNNRITQGAGGPDCIWSAMLWNGGMINQQARFVDLREIGKRCQFLYWDNYARADDESGFEANGDAGKMIHQAIGWDTVVIDTMGSPAAALEWSVDSESKTDALTEGAAYSAAMMQEIPLFKKFFPSAATPEPELRMWTIEGIAGGLGPLWVSYGQYTDDRRKYDAPEHIFQWHQAHETYLMNRTPVASVGVVWSRRNVDYFGRDDAAGRVDAPYRGFTRALVQARIPYLPVHASDIEAQSNELAVLVLPNVGALSERECQAIRAFAGKGGAVIATGATSLYDEWGDRRPDFELADLFGAHAPPGDFGRKPAVQTGSYLRLAPERRGLAGGPKSAQDPAAANRHPVLRGFDQTDIFPFGGVLAELRIDQGVIVPLTFVDETLIRTDDNGMLREQRNDIAALVLNSFGGTRVAYLPADIDRRYAYVALSDYGALLANIVRWTAGDRLGFELEGPGMIDCHVFRQSGRMIVHLINLTNQGTWRTPLASFVPVGPFRLRIKLQGQVNREAVQCLVSRTKPRMAMRQNWAIVEIPSIVDHEVVVIS